jgi:hypothetical protein
MQNEVVSEAKWALAAFIGGKVAGKALDTVGDCIDARRFARLADNAGDAARLANRQQEIRWFKSFRSFKKNMGPPGKGNVWHHIVEQRSPNMKRFGPEGIHNTQNIVAVPQHVNQTIADYYSRKRRFTGGLTVRQWVGSKSWREQFEFGQRVLNHAASGKPLP